MISRRVSAFAWSTAAVAAALVAGRIVSSFTPIPNISLVFLMAVLFSAVSFGIWPAIYASVLSFLAYNFFFIEPLYTFRIAVAHELIALLALLIVAIVTSTLAGKVREQARAADERARVTRRLYEFTWKLSGLGSVDATADGAAGEFHASLGRPAVILLEQGGALSLAAAWPPEDGLDPEAMDLAQSAFAGNRPVGFDADSMSDAAWHFVPLRTQSRSVGVVGIARGMRAEALDADARLLLAALAEQTAAAIERAILAREKTAAQSAAETERVRNILLASVSHDFRTPLAAILGSATSLLELRDKLDPATQAGLLRDIKAEAEGLDIMVRNLLAMTRIDADSLELRRDWVDLREVAERVVSAMRRRGASLDITLALPAELPMIAGDASLIEQMIENVIGNAAAHAPAGTHVRIDARIGPDTVSLQVTDDGPGIPADLLPRVFEKFARAPAHAGAGGRREGTGLGLAIARGIIGAHGGSIAAQSPVADGRGTRMVMTFRRERQQ